MIIHLFPKTQFTEDYILFVRNHFDADRHRFILYSNEEFLLDESVYKIDGVYDYDKESLGWLYKQLSGAQAIILHNLGVLFKELLLLAASKKIIKKCVWMIWGADLYCYRNPKTGIGDRLVEAARKRIIHNLRWTATLTDGDHSLLCEWYGCNTRNFRLEYMSERAVAQMKAKLSEDRNDKTVRILLGNSATRSNCHMEALKMLEKYRDKDIQVIAPLSYGDMEYAEEVISEGKRLLGNAFIPMREFIPKDKYYDFLYSIDIGIFNNNRQEATGNIQALMFYRRKVFIRRDTSMWTEWNDKEGYSLADVAEIEEMSYDEFISKDEAAIENNYHKVYAYYDADARASEWQELFDTICSEKRP